MTPSPGIGAWQHYFDAARRKRDIAEYHLDRLREVITAADAESTIPPVSVQAHFEGVVVSVLATVDQVAQAINSALGLGLPGGKLVAGAYGQLLPMRGLTEWYQNPVGLDLRRLRVRMLHYSYTKTPEGPRPGWLVERTSPQYQGSREIIDYSCVAVGYATELCDALGNIDAELRRRVSQTEPADAEDSLPPEAALQRAKETLATLQGTVVKDLRSMCAWARDFDQKYPKSTEFGGLNFSLALVALVACEAAGFFTTAAAQHRRSPERLQVDTGTYIIQFIEAFFIRTSRFKALSKVLADFLRHALAHGFGAGPLAVTYDIAIYINANTTSEIKVTTQGERKLIAINGIALAEQTINAIDNLGARLTTTPDLARAFVNAQGVVLPIAQGVEPQFMRVFRRAQRDGLVYD